ncbi:MAG: tRNA pseudouridine(13) synthase TruD, partial [Deferrisomatales bacterium]
AEAEAEVLRDLGLEEKLFGRETGTRRPLRVPVGAPAAEAGAGGVWLTFRLPAGAFATSVVREVTGRDGGPP